MSDPSNPDAGDSNPEKKFREDRDEEAQPSEAPSELQGSPGPVPPLSLSPSPRQPHSPSPRQALTSPTLRSPTINKPPESPIKQAPESPTIKQAPESSTIKQPRSPGPSTSSGTGAVPKTRPTPRAPPSTPKQPYSPGQSLSPRRPRVEPDHQEPSTSRATPAPGDSLQQIISRRKREIKNAPVFELIAPLYDPYEIATASNYITRGRTAFFYDQLVLMHKCEWDEKYPENPSRLEAIWHKLRDDGILELCEVPGNNFRDDVHQKIDLVHAPEHYERLKNISRYGVSATFEVTAKKFDSIYFNQFTFDAACRAVSTTLNMAFAIARGEFFNAFALVRPPGHHAQYNSFNGYCYFNNIAIAAEALMTEKLADKILIIDFDVHHGQGTQQMFYKRKDVMYISIHRYEHGLFWPNLMESNYTYMGAGQGVGYNINIPLNATGLTDQDYLAIMFNIILPVSYEFNPKFVLISAGYDAVMGCPEGNMNLTPGLFAHIITLLSGLARGRVMAVLEGGYHNYTMSEAVSQTIKALLGGPCPVLEPIRACHPSVKETINNVKRVFYKYWKCFRPAQFEMHANVNPNRDHEFEISYFGDPPTFPHQTRNCYPVNRPGEHEYATKLCAVLSTKYRAPVKAPVCYTYDEKMLGHYPPEGEVERPERPERISMIKQFFTEFGLDSRLTKIPIVLRDFSEWNPHAEPFMKRVAIGRSESKDIYNNEHTHEAVNYAVCGVLSVIDAVISGQARSGLAVVRPPGHHAEYDKTMGFCFINNVALAANYLYLKHNYARILIVDFDIHHGNGTQNLFYHSNNVMYISIHRFDDGKFYPPETPGDIEYDGHGPGRGYNINIPFNHERMSDAEYILAFQNVVLPAAYSYAPQIVLVSAGFDAGIHDPLGGYNIHPETFGHFIQMLKPLAEGKMVICLEGGYNLTTTSFGMTICAKTLLGDPVLLPKNFYEMFSNEAARTIRRVCDHFKKYHPALDVDKELSLFPLMVKRLNIFTAETHRATLYRAMRQEQIGDNHLIEAELEGFGNAPLEFD